MSQAVSSSVGLTVKVEVDAEDMIREKTLLQEKYRRESQGVGRKQKATRSQSFQVDDRSLQFEQVKRQMLAEMERDIEEHDTKDVVEEQEECIGEEHAEDEEYVCGSAVDKKRSDSLDNEATAAYAKSLGTGSSPGSKIWNYGSPLLYSRLVHLIHYFCSRSLRMRRDLKPRDDPTDILDHETHQDEAATAPTATSGLEVHSLDDGAQAAAAWIGDELERTNAARVEEESDSDSPYQGTADPEQELPTQQPSTLKEERAQEEYEEDEEEHSQDEESNDIEDEEEKEDRDEEEYEEEDATFHQGDLERGSMDVAFTSPENEISNGFAPSEGNCEGEVSAPTPSVYPAIDRLFGRLHRQLDETLEKWNAKGPPLHMDKSMWSKWSRDRWREVHRGVDVIRAQVTMSGAHRLSDISRRMLKVLEIMGFPDKNGSTSAHDHTVDHSATPQCYSYHPRLFPTMTTLNANLSAFGLLAVLNLEQCDNRLGKPTLVPMPHPHPEVNTEVILCEPRKKKSMIDDFRTLPHPKRAIIHGVEDFLVEEELQYRHCIQLKDHLNRHQTLKGLPTHLYTLLFALLDYDADEFSKLQTSKRSLLLVLPTALMRRITDQLKKKIQQLEATRAAVRLSVGKVGFYCQGVLWRDQVVRAVEMFGRHAHHFLRMHEMHSHTQPVLVPNVWALPDEAHWLEQALRMFIVRSEDTELWEVIFNALIPMLRGTWMGRAAVPLSECVGWDKSFGSEGRGVSLVVNELTIQAFQALLAVADILLAAKGNTVMDPLAFLTKLSVECAWQMDDTSVASFLLTHEKTTNLVTARLVALRVGVEHLKMQIAALGDSLAMVKALSSEPDQLTGPLQGCTSALFAVADTFADIARPALLRRMIVSHQPLGGLQPPVLAFVDIPRAPIEDVVRFFGEIADDEIDETETEQGPTATLVSE